MRSLIWISRHLSIVVGIILETACHSALHAADPPATNKSGHGIFVSFEDGTLTLKGKSGQLVYTNVGENYKTYQNNEEGPGSRLVSTVRALSGTQLEGKIIVLSRVLPGTFVRVDVEAKEIVFGFDHRIIGTFVSYQDGKLTLLAADVPNGFIKKPDGQFSVTVTASTPVLESVDGDYLKYTGPAEKALAKAKPGALITARSQYDVNVIEVVEIGTPKHRMERYIGDYRGTVRGKLMSFKDGVLRIRARALDPKIDDYERVVARRVFKDIPIVESVDGGAYRPASIDSLSDLKEGAIITIRKVEDVILEIQIGVPKEK